MSRRVLPTLMLMQWMSKGVQRRRSHSQLKCIVNMLKVVLILV